MKQDKSVRVKSNFTILKERRRQLEAEQSRIGRKLQKLAQLKEELAGMNERYDEIDSEIEDVKADMRKELDL
jgi:predicted nuclease with TOPRIM domain